MNPEMQEILQDFITESRETLDNVEPMILDLGTMILPEEMENAIGSIFRMFHTLKGGAGFLNLSNTEKVTHTTENLLQLFRKDPSTLRAEHIDLVNESCDLIRKLLEHAEIESNDETCPEQVEALIQKLKENIELAQRSTELSSTSFEKSITSSKENQEELFSVSLTEDVLSEFIKDANEYLEKAEGALLVLNQLGNDIDSLEYLQTIFRCFHTLKSNAAMLNFQSIEAVAHKTESFLEEFKSGNAEVNQEIQNLLFKVIDLLKEAVHQLTETQKIEPDLFHEILKQLDLQWSDSSVEQAHQAVGDILVKMGVARPESVEIALKRQRAPVGELLVEMGEIRQQDLDKALEKQARAKGQSGASVSAKRQDIRIGLDKVDQLVNLMGELVIANAMISSHPVMRSTSYDDLEEAVSQLGKNIRNLQDVAMSMRMVPISSTFRKMLRLVHDVAQKTRKLAQLELVGENTEVDKTLVELIADPLLHIIRNAVDHGLESPEERRAAGKNPEGQILLEARHSGNEVWIIVKDDGKGLNREKILEKALSRGLITPEQQLVDEDIWKLIFEPGFSTAEKVTDVSGRGVGMDVVRKNIEKLRGRVDISTQAGKGSTFLLRIPLTLSIVEGLLVRVGQAHYAVPITSVQEAIQPQPSDINKTLNNTEMLKLRGEQLPVIRLSELHQIETKIKNLYEGNLIVVEENEEQVCLFVDEVVGQQQIVVKGLPRYMGHLSHLAGCTILGNGEIGLILDINGLIKDFSLDKSTKPSKC
ncbi:chemotaxis protein CheA [Deltaproteobacteria bacterium TL4]